MTRASTAGAARKSQRTGVKAPTTDCPSGEVSSPEKRPGLRAKPPHTKRALYANVRTDPTTTHTSAVTASGSGSASTNAVSTASLVTKPSRGGTPAMEAAPMTATTSSWGALPATPDSRRMSRVPAWWSMMPTVRNRVALNRPWAITMASPAMAVSAVPKETTAVMNPSWLTVP